MSIITDNTVLVNIYSGLESKNKITLGLLVALNAEKNDHKVTLFLAGDGVQILNCKKAEIKCAEDDTECQTEKSEKFDLKDSLKS